MPFNENVILTACGADEYGEYEIYLYNSEEDYENHKQYMTTVREYKVEDEHVYNNGRQLKVEYRK